MPRAGNGSSRHVKSPLRRISAIFWIYRRFWNFIGDSGFIRLEGAAALFTCSICDLLAATGHLLAENAALLAVSVLYLQYLHFYLQPPLKALPALAQFL
jgi:hypothetical protein